MPRRKRGVVLPVVIDTMPARDMEIPYIEGQIYNTRKTNKKPHLLSPTHINKRKELPF